jgi:hypothetical protein
MTHSSSMVRIRLNLKHLSLLKRGHPFHPRSTVSSTTDPGMMQLPHSLEYTAKKGRVVRFEVFAAVTMTNAIFWDVAQCRSCVNRRL